MHFPSIESLIPHRAPFLFVDRLIHLEKGKKAVGIKHISLSEPYLLEAGGKNVFPGTLVLEALAQVSAIAEGKEAADGSLPLLAGLNGFEFTRPVYAGDTLRLEAEIIRKRRGFAISTGTIWIGESMAAQGEILSKD
ncbi:3-hydroxyacyl-ACP dehydratase FabZ family protein [Paenibacillus dendritiformis]|uniref:(3R)-hydroxymyristoyl-ACP dehydratase n=1 Tax=Paenibacillus dendritiformis C454 TaxID=1131935 RepID=H3SM83_9BACL|nr:3-hydroxyacyl-ACP dehydratase FabZ family protein [Paenibacillus dendritiformis]EHQ59824.1 (3R)-hydroxymyristoyl-ACP dehydratase [Paenibacillus dendritiformis C454]TDL50314.1 beta-hydroxyacyl-ACP dehydratase [Paenibacillus dendritiformis]WGU92453.1 3-hydroxyacyl-ACP dehydratase FabZ family protein [Paenibacillus dendritiformis]